MKISNYFLILGIIAFLCLSCSSDNLAVKQSPHIESSHKNIQIGKVLLSGPTIEVSETEIDLGIIPPEEHEVTGEILFFNAGVKPLQIHKVSGPCACFDGYSGDELLQPEEGGVLEVKFDKKKIPAGDVKRVVRIETNDPENKMVEVSFKFNVERDPDDEELRILKSELSEIRKELRALHQGISMVLAALDNDKPATKRTPDTTIYDIAIGSSPILGPTDTTITIVAFSDFQCPYSIREYPKIRNIMQEYPDKIKFVFKHFPLDFHKKAKPAHATAELANIQGGSELFWEMHNMIIAEPSKLEISDLRKYAEELNMDVTKFDAILADEDKINELLRADMIEVEKCKVRGTPTVLINGLKLVDRSIAGYKSRIDNILTSQIKQEDSLKDKNTMDVNAIESKI